MISIIVAIGKNNEIGKKNDLLWSLPADMKHFKETTSKHTVIMGQKTFESLKSKLPNRRNIVLTQDDNFKIQGVEIVRSLDELSNLLKTTCEKDEENFIIGGGQIYRLFIEKADKLYITHVNESFPDADTYFPIIDDKIWEKIKSEKHPKDELNKYDLEFVEYTKK
ncbi:MAG: dihydrofolate reductase [bacterium]